MRGSSIVCAFPQVITWYLISGKCLVYFGNVPILLRCLWKEGEVHLGFVLHHIWFTMKKRPKHSETFGGRSRRKY